MKFSLLILNYLWILLTLKSNLIAHVNGECTSYGRGVGVPVSCKLTFALFV